MVRAMGRNKVGGVEVEHQRVSNQLTFAEAWSQTVTSLPVRPVTMSLSALLQMVCSEILELGVDVFFWG